MRRGVHGRAPKPAPGRRFRLRFGAGDRVRRVRSAGSTMRRTLRLCSPRLSAIQAGCLVVHSVSAGSVRQKVVVMCLVQQGMSELRYARTASCISVLFHASHRPRVRLGASSVGGDPCRAKLLWFLRKPGRGGGVRRPVAALLALAGGRVWRTASAWQLCALGSRGVSMARKQQKARRDRPRWGHADAGDARTLVLPGRVAALSASSRNALSQMA